MSEHITDEARILLTSAGVTTDNIREQLVAQVDSSRLNVLRFSDGWEADGPLSSRLAHSAHTMALRWWSENYLQYAFGDNHELKTVSGAKLTDAEMSSGLRGADVVLIPGGNTYLTARGLEKHIETIREQVQLGSFLLLTESAGTIFAGSSLRPAGIEPADQRPTNFSSTNTLNLIEAHMVVHTSGRKERLTLPLGKIAGRSLRQNETSPEALEEYVSSLDSLTPIYVLNDAEALQISNRQLSIVGERGSKNVVQTLIADSLSA